MTLLEEIAREIYRDEWGNPDSDPSGWEADKAEFCEHVAAGLKLLAERRPQLREEIERIITSG